MRSIHKTIIFFSLCFIVIFSFIWANPVPAAANRGLSVPANRLPNELKRTDIKDYYAGSGTKQVGSIQTVIGHVVVARQGLRSAYYAAPGDRLFEKDIIYTLKGSKCRFRLIGEDVVMMGENTHLGIKDYQTNQQKSTKSSVMTVARGKAMFYALRLFKHRSNAMIVETPTAVSGVRGTKWGVEVLELAGGRETASRPIELADTSDTGLRILAQANPPSLPLFQTTILCFSGTVFTGSTAPPPPGAPPPPVVTLLQGQMTTVGTGQSPASPSLTPTALANSFTAGTFAPPPGDSGPPSIPGMPPSTGSLTIPQTNLTTTTTPDTGSITQQQVQQTPVAIDTVINPGTNYSGSDGGYIALMMTNKSGLTLEEIFASYLRQDGSGNVWALGSKNTTTDYIRAWGEGGSGSTPYLKYAVFNSGNQRTGDLAYNYPITDVDLEKLTYLTLSYFTMPLTLSAGGSTYTQDTRGYAVFGYNTPSIAGISGVGTYSGNAYGTYWTMMGGINMTGSFAAIADFSTRSITSYTMYVSGGAASALISNATGSIGTDGHFDISGGTWVLNSNVLTSTDYKTAHGSFYGPNAEYIGGNWAMLNKVTNEGAVGIYGGSGTIQTRPTTHQGLFVGMLTNTSATSYAGTYMSDGTSSEMLFDSQQAKAWNSSDYVRVCTTQMYELVASGYPVSSGMPKSLQKQELGYNAYMEWGYWTQPVAMNNSLYNSAFDNKGYYVWGEKTASLPSSFSGTYTGVAYGTDYSTNGGTDKGAGTFSMTVSYSGGSGTITNFSALAGSAGSQSGVVQTTAATFNSSGIYTISGTGYVNGSTALESGTAVGTFYGPDAKKTGGVWKAAAGGAYANGLFVGSRP